MLIASPFTVLLCVLLNFCNSLPSVAHQQAKYLPKYYAAKFEQYKLNHELSFPDPAEHDRRLQIYSGNLDFIDAHNADPHNTVVLGETQWSHYTNAEFRQLTVRGYKPRVDSSTRVTQALTSSTQRRVEHLRKLSTSSMVPSHIPTSLLTKAPAPHSVSPTRVPTKTPTCKPSLKPTFAPTVVPPPAIDWTTHTVNGSPVVGPIKNQGMCGSCWAFTSVSVMESAYTLKYGVHNVYSEQEVVSCDTAMHGCSGGNEAQVYGWTATNGGLTLETAYPYASSSGTAPACVTTGYTNDATLKPLKTYSVATGFTKALQAAVAQQPVAIAIDSASSVFQFYTGGVITTGCGNHTDHSVVLVGYNNTAKVPYFKIRNSWGTGWGIGGYALISTDQKLNACNILNFNSYTSF